MAEKKATREGFGAALAELGEKYDFLVLDADLAAATKTGIFKKKYRLYQYSRRFARRRYCSARGSYRKCRMPHSGNRC